MGWLAVTAAALLISGGAAPLGLSGGPPPLRIDGRAPAWGSVPPIQAVVHTRSVPVVAVADLTFEPRDGEDPQAAARRLQTALLDRLKPFQARLDEDPSLRRVGPVVGLGVAALGALRREQPLIAVGGSAVRIGLDHQLSTIQRSTGFTVVPRLECGGFSITLTRTFQ